MVAPVADDGALPQGEGHQVEGRWNILLFLVSGVPEQLLPASWSAPEGAALAGYGVPLEAHHRELWCPTVSLSDKRHIL